MVGSLSWGVKTIRVHPPVHPYLESMPISARAQIVSGHGHRLHRSKPIRGMTIALLSRNFFLTNMS